MRRDETATRDVGTSARLFSCLFIDVETALQSTLQSAAATAIAVVFLGSRTLSYANTLSSRTPAMIRTPPATLANTKSDAALGGAPGSKLPDQIKTNNQHTQLDKAMPVRGTP